MEASKRRVLVEVLLGLVPSDGAQIGNQKLRERFQATAKSKGHKTSEEDFEALRESLIEDGTLARGKGRGGAVRRAKPDDAESFGLAPQSPPEPREPSKQSKKKSVPRGSAASDQPQVLSYRHSDKRKNNPQVGLVNETTDPPAPKTTWKYDPHIDPALSFDMGRAQVERIIDDALESRDEKAMRDALEQLKRASGAYLNWTGKAERTSFEIDTVSLHVHERIDPMSVLSAISKQAKDERAGKSHAIQPGLFEAPFESLPLREAVDFYKHERGWSNRLICGDSLLVMNSLLQKESLAGQVQMVYIDPPYGIKYGSNFQPFVGKPKVKDRKDTDLTQEPEMIRAFRDTWELGLHSYLTYLRDRLLLSHALLGETGSVFVQISDENIHHVRELGDELFGPNNFVSIISFRKTTGQSGNFLPDTNDYLIWYAKNRERAKFSTIYQEREGFDWVNYDFVALPNGNHRRMTKAERSNPEQLVSEGCRVYRRSPLTSDSRSESTAMDVTFQKESFSPGKGGWKTNAAGFKRLGAASRLESYGTTIAFRRYTDDFPFFPYSNAWTDTASGGYSGDKIYVVQTNDKVIERCMLMTTEPGDLVLDPTCGSGTTAYVAEKLGRRWITCDTSRVSVTLAKQRLMTSSYDYYELRYPHEGLKGGFIYKAVPHLTLKSIANNTDVDDIYERFHPNIVATLKALNAALKKTPPDHPFTISDGSRKGESLHFRKGAAFEEWEVPFAFPDIWPGSLRAPFDAFCAARRAMQRQIDLSIAAHAESEVLYDQPEKSKTKLRITGPFTVEAVPFPTVLSLSEAEQPTEADVTIARSGESARQHSWRDELVKTGIRGKGGQMLRFSSLEALAGTVCLHASGTLDSGERVVVSFGPEHGALEQRQVEHALREAGELFPLPKIVVFCAFEFDPEAAKDIDAVKGITALKAKMNTDLLTEDLKKARSSNQSFWLMGQPDVDLRKHKDGSYVVEVNGFDYFDTVKGELVSGGKAKIAMWLLDTDYDDRSLFPRQVFFPMAGKDDGWHKLKRDIRAELDEGLLDKFHGSVSLPFHAGDNRKIAVKIVDDRGIESLKVIPLS